MPGLTFGMGMAIDYANILWRRYHHNESKSALISRIKHVLWRIWFDYEQNEEVSQ